MRALAHPARLTILTHLMPGVASTATELAELVDLSPSATSYHLRALAKVGLVVQAPGRGDARERVWRSAYRGFEVRSGPQASPDVQAAGKELIGQFLLFQEAAARRWIEQSTREPQEWWDASAFAGSQVVMTAEELAEVTGKVADLVNRYRREVRGEVPPGARPVTWIYRAFPSDPPPADRSGDQAPDREPDTPS